MTTPHPSSHIAPLGTLWLSVTFCLFLLRFWQILTPQVGLECNINGSTLLTVSFLFSEPHPCLGMVVSIQDYLMNASFFAKYFPIYFHWVFYDYSGNNSSIFSSKKPVLNFFPGASAEFAQDGILTTLVIFTYDIKLKFFLYVSASLVLALKSLKNRGPHLFTVRATLPSLLPGSWKAVRIFDELSLKHFCKQEQYIPSPACL